MNDTIATQPATQAKVLIADVMRMRRARAHGGASTDITSMATIDWMASRLAWFGHDFIARVAAFDAATAKVMADFDGAPFGVEGVAEAFKAEFDACLPLLWDGDSRCRAQLNDTYAMLRRAYGDDIAREFVIGLGYEDALAVLR